MHYNRTIQELWEELKTNERGLSPGEAQNRYREYGPNEITAKGANPPWIIFLHQLKDPLVIILIIAAGVALLVSDYLDAMVIFAVVIINAIIGFVQEYKADKAMLALKKMSTSQAKVVRSGKEMRIDSRELIPGDIAVMTAGNKVPADVRLFEEHHLEIDESMLTGESMPVAKSTKVLPEPEVSVADQSNIAFMGTVVTNGRGKGVVIETGMRTQIGKISRQVEDTEKQATPLQRRLKVFTNIIGSVALGLAGMVVLIGILTGREIVEMVLFGISTAVAVIPEGLPIVVTVTMAVGIQRMAKRNAIIRKLVAVETLGSCNYICSDKTGTITENRMSVVQAYANEKEFHFQGTGYEPRGIVLLGEKRVDKDRDLELLLLTGALCNASQLYEEGGEWKINGDPTEGALLVSAARYGIDLEESAFRHEFIEE